MFNTNNTQKIYLILQTHLKHTTHKKTKNLDYVDIVQRDILDFSNKKISRDLTQKILKQLGCNIIIMKTQDIFKLIVKNNLAKIKPETCNLVLQDNTEQVKKTLKQNKIKFTKSKNTFFFIPSKIETTENYRHFIH